MFSIELEEDCWVLVESSGLGVRLVNGVAAFIATLSAQGLDEAAIVVRLIERYDVDADRAHHDVTALLGSLHEKAGIVLKEAGPYQPTTDFIPSVACKPVEACEVYLPGFKIRFASELSGLNEHLRALFSLPAMHDRPLKELSIEVHKDRDRYPVVHEGKTLDTGYSLPDAAIKCLREVNGLIGRDVPYTIIFHASAVARNGKAVLFPAAGGSGKTTLSAYLMAHGFEFINDDAVPLCSQSALLLPIPLSLSIKRGSWSVLDTWFPELKQATVYGAADHPMRYLAPLADAVCSQPVKCAMLVLPVYSPDSTDLQVEPVSTRNAFEHIIKSGCILDQPVDPRQIAALVNWLKPLPAYRVTYSNLKAVKLWLNSHLC